VQQEHARLRSNRDAYLIRHLQAATSLEVFLGQKNLHVTEQLDLIRWLQTPEYREISLDDGAPRLRKWLRAKTCSPTPCAEAEDHTGT